MSGKDTLVETTTMVFGKKSKAASKPKGGDSPVKMLLVLGAISLIFVGFFVWEFLAFQARYTDLIFVFSAYTTEGEFLTTGYLLGGFALVDAVFLKQMAKGGSKFDDGLAVLNMAAAVLAFGLPLFYVLL